ncbi:Glycosyltransferase involved in cell wall bisynthesis [Enhydrobacter aerosaccus]|uniref:Glycosyltransferase involved in cell wall bisynthesis n=1 Tax=Enhydrobacter aerosaccus TaxID=225324 RepID=A0A1T4T9Z2_9HYPH|nr:glycosyltransferase family 4 protein [Enhydrobacter aerosaccus]SKA37213.1 Glycosyltransferase involved in cell wall bisynthesis [Enhydrobacter aerosaccus]
MAMRIGFLVSHPIQYLTPLFRELDKRCDLTVYFAHRQTAEQQADSGFGVAFEWDLDLLSGYRSEFLSNISGTPSPDTFWGCNTPDIARRISDGRFDAFIVPGWALWSYWQATIACRRNGVPVLVRGDSQLVTQRGGVMRLVKELVFPQVLRCFDGFLYVGQRNRDYLIHYGVPAERLFFSPHCVDNDAFKKASEAARHLRPEPPPSDRPRLLFVGKLIPRKNPLDLLRAAALLQKRGVAVEVLFAGSGDLADELADFAKTAGLAVQFLGFANQTQLPAIYAAADVIVLPSRIETWGLVVNEAMACGLPAIVSDAVGCAPDLVETGRTGAVHRLGDIPALAEAIETVLHADRPAQRRNVAERIAAYSPAAAATGILEGAATVRARRFAKAAKAA